jgi:hypothetical protein
MTTNHTPAHWRQVTAIALFIATATASLSFASTAEAQPNNGGGPGGSGEWDIGLYDYCMAHPEPGTLGSTEAQLDHHRWCCESTGGVWGSGDNGCHAPPAELNGPTDPFGQGVLPPRSIQAPPPPVNPTAPILTGTFG